MATAIYRINFTPRPGSFGTQVEYRQTGGAWTTPSTAPNPTMLSYYDLTLTKGQSYDVRVSSIGRCSPKYQYIHIDVPAGVCCATGFTMAPDQSYCYQDNTTAPTITQSNVCFAPAPLAGQYSSAGTRVFDPGYAVDLGSGSFSLINTGTYWIEPPGGITGPMNREAIWLDSNCDGSVDALTAGAIIQFTIPIVLANPTTLYVGMGGDNSFTLVLNGTTIADTTGGGSSNFNYWWIVPVNFPAGTSYLNFKGVGDGSTSDSFATVVYNNTKAQILAATQDSDLNILFKSSSLRGGRLNIATCPTGYFLDTSGGVGAYICKQRVTSSPFSC